MKTTLRRSIFFITFLLICSKTYAQEVPLQILESGYLIVTATVEGKKGNFIFDPELISFSNPLQKI